MLKPRDLFLSVFTIIQGMAIPFPSDKLPKMCPIFVISVHNFGKSDDDII